jgi:2-iminobutanoate/2-iminopropanoate deaminase
MFMVLVFVCCVFAARTPVEGGGAEKKIFHLGDKPGGTPFSPAVLYKGTLYISGQLAVDPATGKFTPGTMTEEATRVIKNIEILAKKAGMGLSDVVQTSVFISDFEEFAEFNKVFRSFFPNQPPTRATVEVSALARGAKIEIAAIAVE